PSVVAARGKRGAGHPASTTRRVVGDGWLEGDGRAEGVAPQPQVERPAQLLGPQAGAEPGASPVDEAIEGPLPEVLGGGVAAVLQLADPVRDRAVVLACHRTPPAVP